MMLCMLDWRRNVYIGEIIIPKASTMAEIYRADRKSPEIPRPYAKAASKLTSHHVLCLHNMWNYGFREKIKSRIGKIECELTGRDVFQLNGETMHCIHKVYM